MATSAPLNTVRYGVWRALALTLVILLLLVTGIVGLDALWRPKLSGIALQLIGLLLALIPALLWLIFFYLQDRVEPEPKTDIARTFIIGLALAGALGVPITTQFFRLQDWLNRDVLSALAGSIFINGAVEAFVVFASVRYFIYSSPQFNERTDGIIYGTSAGLGYATVLNWQLILSNTSASLGAVEVTMAETALAHAAFAGLLGYFLGRAKMERDPLWWLPTGVALTALLNGLFNLLRSRLLSGGIEKGLFSVMPAWQGLVLAGLLAVVIAVLNSFLINRDIRQTLSGRPERPASEAAIGDRQANFAAIAVFIIMLAIGCLGWYRAEFRTVPFQASGIEGSYPASYTLDKPQDEALRLVDTLGTGAVISLQVWPLEMGQEAHSTASQLAAERAGRYRLYQVTEQSPITISRKPALMQRFNIVDAPTLEKTPLSLLEGVDYIFISEGKAVIASLQASPDSMPLVEPQFLRFIDSLRFQ